MTALPHKGRKDSSMCENNTTRPEFPKRALITGGMPYGEKDIYFHHVGGYFIHADISCIPVDT